ncbi:MAG: DUF58 domain-containing protein [Lachnospiraceae bacterium]|nr:DUF58 domain-containing protein [Lachnospiraceae bacterium]
MKMNYVSRIQSNLKKYKTINTNKITTRILDGSYNSVYKGRSMNFDELREYVPGDEIKDMDWKASARGNKLLVRQYIAEKKHNIMLVIDSNCRMLANANDTQDKAEVALLSAGTLAYLVNRNGDYVSATFATKTSVNHIPFRSGLMNIENILSSYHKAVTLDNDSDLNKPLEFILHNYNRRMIILIVTDITGIDKIKEDNLKRLLVRHDVLLVDVSDADLSGKNVYDVEMGSYLPDFFTRDKKFVALEEEKKQSFEQRCIDKLKRYGIASSVISNTKDIDAKIIELLEKHKENVK